MKALLETVIAGKDLTRQQAQLLMEMMAQGKMEPAQMAGLLCALRAKGESAVEVAAFAETLQDYALPVTLNVATDDVVIDTCGTGGDQSSTFNISTCASFILAAGGIKVAKHGNRSVSSNCGSADVLEQLGVAISLNASDVARSIETLGFGFMFAPQFHPAFKHIVPVRRALGVRTIFNLLGPLVNPAKPSRQIIGVYDIKMIELVAEALKELGSKEALVIAAEDGLDEFSTNAVTQVAHLKNGTILRYQVSPEDIGFKRASLKDLRGNSAEHNAQIIENILKGTDQGPCRDIVALNAGAGFMLAGKASSIKEGTQMALEILNSGKAMTLLEHLKAFE